MLLRLFPAVFVLCAVAGCLIAGVNLLTMHALAATLRRRPRNCPLPAFSLLFSTSPSLTPPLLCLFSASPRRTGIESEQASFRSLSPAFYIAESQKEMLFIIDK